MIFCEHCFNDKEIASIICAISASNTGECPVCHHRDGHLYDTSIQSELTPYFEETSSKFLDYLFISRQMAISLGF